MVEALATRLARRHDVVVVTSSWGSASGVEENRRLRVHRLPAIHRAETWGVPYPVPYGPGTRRALRDLANCDLLHAHGALYVGSLCAALLTRRKVVPMVLTEHVGFVPYGSAAIMGLQRAAWALLGDSVVASSRSIVTYNGRVQDWMRKRYPQREIAFLENGVDASRFRPLDADERRRARTSFGLPLEEPLVLYAGRATEKKNFPTVEAIPREGFQLVVCGAERRLQQPRAIDLGVVPHARMPDLYGCVDVFVVPSVGEGFPLSLQEAMAAGCPPVVLWDAGYDRSLDRDHVVACIALEEVAGAVLALVKDPAERERRSRMARAWVERSWNWELTVAGYERIFNQLVHT
jgi:D-inositol-3-phosphate glycosyltransferase